MPSDTKATLKAAFDDFDYYTAKLVAASKQIKLLAPVYWQERGFTVQPRLERLRESVFSQEG